MKYRLRHYLTFAFLTVYCFFIEISQIFRALHGERDINLYFSIFSLCMGIIFWITIVVRWVKEVSSQKAGADPLADPGQEHPDESSSATFPPNVEKRPKEHRLFSKFFTKRSSS